jgi:hypothetical protein
LHIGYYKSSHLKKTRYYAGGRLIWAALTSKLTKLLSIDNYEMIGDYLKNVLRIGYLFPYAKGSLYLPKYTSEGLFFNCSPDPISKDDFERRFVSSIKSTAINPLSQTSEEEMLFEIEFIMPYTRERENEIGRKTFLKGLVWINLDSKLDQIKIEIKNNDVIINYNNLNINFQKELANRFQIGGERTYGLGLIELLDFSEIKKKQIKDFPSIWFSKNNEIYLKIKRNEAIWCPLLYREDISFKKKGDLEIKGDLEPLVGRKWSKESGAGKDLTFKGFIWKPGTIANQNITCKINEDGLFELEDS